MSLLDPSSSMEVAEDSRNIHGWMLVKVCATPEGKVNHVSLIHTSNEALTGPVFDMIRTWRYRPYLLDGVARPFCYPARIER
jgi:hypothetical protein